MNLDDVRNLINIISGEKLSGKKLSPEQFTLIAQQANLKHFKKKVGLPEEYQPGSPLPRQAYEITTKITMDIAPFKVHMGKTGEVPLYIDIDGYATTPLDMYYPSTLMYNYTAGSQRKIDIVSDEEWVDRIGDALTKPTLRNPIANIQNDYIRFSPIKNKFAEFVYLRFPTDPVFGYTQSAGFVEYNASTSVEFEWNAVNVIDIIVIMLFDLGINMDKAEVLQYSDKTKQQGI